ncbi:hypothetical protein VHUM_02466 [Vanrija humicola]|uniref:DUF7729 domain-containing protein n=1 Tax=Vanrija humicola TaxID=5417 RepID=A0A7D8V0C2_VANHU|nr:hypothetical protein VHUM_02466 [Vanrija humicola]
MRLSTWGLAFIVAIVGSATEQQQQQPRHHHDSRPRGLPPEQFAPSPIPRHRPRQGSGASLDLETSATSSVQSSATTEGAIITFSPSTSAPGDGGSPDVTRSSVPTSSTTATRADIPPPKAPATIPTAAPQPVPTPLDAISYSLSQSCLEYVGTLIAPSSKFMTCLPFSLLLSTSAAYKNQVLTTTRTGNWTFLNELLAYTNSPQPSPGSCDQTFQSILTAYADKANCGNDLSGGPAVAKQAQTGIGNYAVMRTASGLINPNTGVYCYLEALANVKPDDMYLWMLPSGNIIPATSTPTCSPCSGLLMNHFAAWTANTTSLNSTLISSAVATVNGKCGSSFISTTPVASSAYLPGRPDGLSLAFLSLLIGALLHL